MRIDCNDYICAFMAAQETNIMHRVMLALSKAGAVVFRNNVGVAVAPNGGVVRYGLCNGSSDIIGWKPVTITPDMVGKTVAVFVAVETKSARGRTSKEQDNFITRVREAGGITGVARDESEALSILQHNTTHTHAESKHRGNSL